MRANVFMVGPQSDQAYNVSELSYNCLNAIILCIRYTYIMIALKDCIHLLPLFVVCKLNLHRSLLVKSVLFHIAIARMILALGDLTSDPGGELADLWGL